MAAGQGGRGNRQNAWRDAVPGAVWRGHPESRVPGVKSVDGGLKGLAEASAASTPGGAMNPRPGTLVDRLLTTRYSDLRSVALL